MSQADTGSTPSDLPAELPVPEDDGAASHLRGLKLPSIPLPATDGSSVDLAGLPGLVVVYAYPMTGRPGVAPPDGWDEIPGARGCTPQSCSFRDHFRELEALGVTHVFGLSTQDSDYQREARDRLRLPFELLSDERLDYARALRLPTMEVEGRTLLKRLSMILRDGVVETVFYPVFPPDRSAADVVDWLKARG